VTIENWKVWSLYAININIMQTEICKTWQLWDDIKKTEQGQNTHHLLHGYSIITFVFIVPPSSTYFECTKII